MKLGYGIAAAIALVLVLASIPLAARTGAFSAYNDRGDGTSQLYEIGRDGLVPRLTHDGRVVEVAHGPIGTLDAAQHALLIVAPQIPFGAEETTRLRTFLDAGGIALIADDVGSGADLVARLNVGIELREVTVFSPVYSKTPAFPLARSTGAIPDLPAQVVLDLPRVVVGNGTIVLVTHDLSWLDGNEDGEPDLGEPKGPWPVAQIVRVGAGELLVLADPSLLSRDLDAVQPAVPDALLEWLLRDGRTLVLDEGHRTSVDPFGATRWLAEGPSLLVGTAALAGSSAGVLWAALRVTVRPKAPKPPSAPRLDARGRLEMAVLAELEER